MSRLKKISLIIYGILMFNNGYSQATCSGTYTSTTNDCQNFNIGNGTTGYIQVCLDANNFPTAGGSNCTPGGTCAPTYTGGGNNPSFAVHNSSNGLVGTFVAASAVGDCITVPVNDGVAEIYGMCLTAGTTISWQTIDACGQNVCSSTPSCDPPGACGCTNPCGPACGWTTAPTVAQVTSGCPEYEYIPPIGTNVTSSSCYTFTANNATVDFNVVISSNCGGPGPGGGNVSAFTWELYTTGSCGSTIMTGTLGGGLTMNPLTVGQSYTYCYTFTTPGCTHFGHYPYFVGAVPLTVELIDFKSQTIGEEIEIVWNVASEYDNDHYILERSADGENFVELGATNGQGMSGEALTYTAYDRNPMDGVNYYRLKNVDATGAESQLGIASSTYVSADAFETNLIYVYDLGGNLVEIISLPENSYGNQEVDQLNLENGVYLIKMFNKLGETKSFKKVVSNHY
jgi:hypothetical protein